MHNNEVRKKRAKSTTTADVKCIHTLFWLINFILLNFAVIFFSSLYAVCVRMVFVSLLPLSTPSIKPYAFILSAFLLRFYSFDWRKHCKNNETIFRKQKEKKNHAFQMKRRELRAVVTIRVDDVCANASFQWEWIEQNAVHEIMCECGAKEKWMKKKKKRKLNDGSKCVNMLRLNVYANSNASSFVTQNTWNALFIWCIW